MSDERDIVPVVGMGVTMSIGSDQYPCTVTKVVSAKRCIVQRDQIRRVDSNGLSEDQSYLFVPDAKGEEIEIFRSKHGAWRKYGGSKSYYFHLGRRSAYRDPSF